MPDMTRRELLPLGAAALVGACAHSNHDHGSYNLLNMPLADLATGLHTGRYTSRGLVRWYLDRIESIDRRGPKLNSVIELNPEALQQAEVLDRELAQRGPRTALHGVPVLIKDNIEVAGAMSTTAGSMALDGWRAPTDAPVAARLRAAGAVILGKTNLSEWANFRSSRSSSGWSGRGGQTLNPHALDRSPSGSSSGSAAAVAASLCAVAVGTETNGSVVSPASVCGVVGVKPTVGLISQAGIIPIAHSQDTAGPMARCVRDAALLLNILADKHTTDFAAGLNAKALVGVRLGVARKFFERNELMNRFLDAQVELLRKQGATVVDPVELPSHGQFGSNGFEVLLYEFKADLNTYLQRLPASFPARSLKALIEFNTLNARREMPWFGQEIFQRAEEKGPLTEKAYLDARATCLRLSRDEGIDAALEQNKVEALIAPTTGPAGLIDWINGDHGMGGCSTPAAIAGYPHVTVPAGSIGGLPVGLSFFGAAWSEARLLGLAYAFEQAAAVHLKPALKAGGAAPAAL